MSDVRDDDNSGDKSDDTSGGSVSEVANLGDGGPISPDQSVAGAPGAEGEGVQEGRQGPNAVTGDESEAGRDLGRRAGSRDHDDPSAAGDDEQT